MENAGSAVYANGARVLGVWVLLLELVTDIVSDTILFIILLESSFSYAECIFLFVIINAFFFMDNRFTLRCYTPVYVRINLQVKCFDLNFMFLNIFILLIDLL